MSNRLGLKQFRTEGCLSYLLWDPTSRDALVIDPRLEIMEDVRALIAENGLKPVIGIDTHIHADHDSATHLFRQEYGAEIAMSHLTASHRVTRKLRHGDRIRAGALSFEVLETPGHTADSISIHGEGMVFTGDTLFIGSSGRTDFPTADPAAQWNSIHKVLGQLPDDTQVMPGHDYSDMLFSTIRVERRLNPHWLLPSLEAFVEMKRNEPVPTAYDEIRSHVAYNCEQAPPVAGRVGGPTGTACGTACAAAAPVTSISIKKYASKLDERAAGTLFIDVREREEYAEAHIPGTENIPLSEIGLHLDPLRIARRVYISCLSGRRSQMAVKTLSYLGLKDVVNVTGGFKGWVTAGLKVSKR